MIFQKLIIIFVYLLEEKKKKTSCKVQFSSKWNGIPNGVFFFTNYSLFIDCDAISIYPYVERNSRGWITIFQFPKAPKPEAAFDIQTRSEEISSATFIEEASLNNTDGLICRSHMEFKIQIAPNLFIFDVPTTDVL